MNHEKSIETSQLLIKGNLIIWEKMMIQISSISYVSEAPPDKKPFPIWSLLPTFLGVYLFQYNKMMSFFVISIGLGWMFVWLLVNKARQEKRILTLAMNSNERLCFQFNDKVFLHKAMTILRAILMNGGLGGKSIVINIKDNKINGDAGILNGLKV